MIDRGELLSTFETEMQKSNGANLGECIAAISPLNIPHCQIIRSFAA